MFAKSGVPGAYSMMIAGLPSIQSRSNHVVRVNPVDVADKAVDEVPILCARSCRAKPNWRVALSIWEAACRSGKAIGHWRSPPAACPIPIGGTRHRVRRGSCVAARSRSRLAVGGGLAVAQQRDAQQDADGSGCENTPFPSCRDSHCWSFRSNRSYGRWDRSGKIDTNCLEHNRQFVAQPAIAEGPCLEMQAGAVGYTDFAGVDARAGRLAQSLKLHVGPFHSAISASRPSSREIPLSMTYSTPSTRAGSSDTPCRAFSVIALAATSCPGAAT